MKKFLKIGHRGAAGLAPENTLKSFKKALELKVDMVEFDVQRCRSGELVVIHDSTVNRTTNGEGKVSQKTLKELKNLDAGNGEKIPTLKEVLDLVNKKAKINIELKDKEIAKTAADLIKNYVKKHGWRKNDFLVSSFDYQELLKFHKLYPKIKIGVLIKKNLAWGLKFAQNLGAYSVNPSLKIVGQNLIKKAHQSGLKIFVWTVNNPKDVKKMKGLGINGIFSNFPDQL